MQSGGLNSSQKSISEYDNPSVNASMNSRNKTILYNEQGFNKLFNNSPSGNSIYFDPTKSRVILADGSNLNHPNKDSV